MDFAFTPEQEALRELARTICQDHATHERLKAVERDPDWFDRELWAALAEANLLGVALPEERRRQRPRAGGALPPARAGRRGRGAGARVADARARARCRSPSSAAPAQRERWLPPRGGGRRDPHRGARRAAGRGAGGAARRARVRDGAGWRLDGVKDCVPAGAPRGRDPRAGAHGRRAGRRLPRRSVRAGRDARAADGDQPRAAGAAHARRRARRGRRRPRRSGARARRSSSGCVDRALLGLCAIELGVGRARAAHDRAVHHRAQAVRPADRAASRPCSSAPPTPTSTSRRSA